MEMMVGFQQNVILHDGYGERWVLLDDALVDIMNHNENADYERTMYQLCEGLPVHGTLGNYSL